MNIILQIQIVLALLIILFSCSCFKMSKSKQSIPLYLPIPILIFLNFIGIMLIMGEGPINMQWVVNFLFIVWAITAVYYCIVFMLTIFKK